jgi:hypothetical protein
LDCDCHLNFPLSASNIMSTLVAALSFDVGDCWL